MHTSKKWVALAIAHLIIITCLTIGITLIAIRMNQQTLAANNAIPSIPITPPSDAEIARLKLLSTRMDIMQYNLANADTVAFKRQRVNVEDGVQPNVAALQLDMTQGALEDTHQKTDLAIQGDGFFHVKVRPTLADGTAYTRNGMLRRNVNGDLVVAIGDGCQLIPPINIPPAATELAIETDGTINYQLPGTAKVFQAGQLQLCRFPNAQDLSRTDNLYVETNASGTPVINNPGESGAGVILQGYLEASNVDPLKEWAGLLRAQKMFQLISQTTQITGMTPHTPHQLTLFADASRSIR